MKLHQILLAIFLAWAICAGCGWLLLSWLV